MGLKQGDNLSPLEFNFFFDDVREIFDEKCDLPLPFPGIFLSHLLFADDMIMMSMSANGMQRCLDNLKSYCNKWHLEVMHQSIPSTNIPPGLTPGEFFEVVKFPAPGRKFLRNYGPGAKIDKNPAPGDNFVDLQDNFAMIVKPFAFFWYSSLAWLSSSLFKDYKACEYKISQ